MVAEISVIIPCYNHGRYLGEALDSVLAQTYADWETIVVDDGSTDTTAAVAAGYADDRIRYVYQENQGLSAARNTGIEQARGSYLAFLDADDRWEPAFLQTCHSALDTAPELVGVIVRNYFFIQEEQRLPVPGGEVVPAGALHDRLLEGGFFPVHAVLVRRAVVPDRGAFDTGLTSLEDWDLWLRVTAHGAMQCLPAVLAGYRVNPGSMSTNAGRMHTNRLRVLSKQVGPAEGDPARWPAHKRKAYGFAYRLAAFGHVQQGEPDTGWDYLWEAVTAWPALLARVDTFYELACGDQPRGQRGHVPAPMLQANGTEMMARLDGRFAGASGDVLALRATAYAHGYLALAMLADRAGDWGLARNYMLRACRSDPALLANGNHLRRLLKVTLIHPRLLQRFRTHSANDRLAMQSERGV